MNILRIESSALHDGSQSRALNDRVLARISGAGLHPNVVTRDLNNTLPQLDAAWVGANSTAVDDRTDAQTASLELSETLVAEVEAADTLLIGLAVYNFSVSAALKLWIDQICRAGRTFSYSEQGPKGLMEGKKAIVTFASGGTPFGSEIDFASGYIRHILGFIGITDVEFAVADQIFMDDQSLPKAQASADKIADNLIHAMAEPA